MPTSGAILDKNSQPDSESAALPQEYGVTMAALMPRDPNWMFVYWEITPNTDRTYLRKAIRYCAYITWLTRTALNKSILIFP